MAALVASRPIFGRTDLFAGLNGAIAGLVSITAAPNFTDHYWAVIIGAIGGVICVAGLKLLEKVKLDDVVGAVPRTSSPASGERWRPPSQAALRYTSSLSESSR